MIHVVTREKALEIMKAMSGEDILQYSLIIYSFVKSASEHHMGPYRLTVPGLLYFLQKTHEDCEGKEEAGLSEDVSHIVKLRGIISYLLERGLLVMGSDDRIDTTSNYNNISENMQHIANIYGENKQSFDVLFDSIVLVYSEDFEEFKVVDNLAKFKPSRN